MNTFLKNLKEAATLEHSVQIEVAGQKMLVVSLDSGLMNELVMKAEYFAEQELRGDKKELQKIKLTKGEREDYATQWKGLVGDSGPEKVFNTEYDKRMFITHATWMGKLSIVYSIRTMKGERIFSSNPELREACETLQGIPGLEGRVKAAWTEIQKKRSVNLAKDSLLAESN